MQFTSKSSKKRSTNERNELYEVEGEVITSYDLVKATPEVTQQEYIQQLLELAITEVNSGRITEGVKLFKSIIRIEPFNEIALLWLGYLATDVYESMFYFDLILTVNPHHLEARENVEQALINFAQGQIFSHISSSSAEAEKTLIANLKNKDALAWLGEILLKEGLINRNQLDIALSKQQALALSNKWKPLGELMVQLKFIDRTQLQQTLSTQLQFRTQLR